MLREKILSQKNQRKALNLPLSDNPFGNASFYGLVMNRKKMTAMKYLPFFALALACVCACHAGIGGHYVLDEYGDRDANFSIIYTSTVTEKVAYCYFLNLVLSYFLSSSV